MAIVITEGYANEGESSTLQRASPPILLQRAGPPVLSEVRATAYGTVGSNCGPPSHGRNPSCRLEGFVFCGHPLSPPEKIPTNTRDYDGDRRYQRRRHTIVGPLTASAFRGVLQCDGAGNESRRCSAPLALDIVGAAQQEPGLCPNPEFPRFVTFTPVAWIAQVAVNKINLLTERCDLNVGDDPNETAVAHCQPF